MTFPGSPIGIEFGPPKLCPRLKRGDRGGNFGQKGLHQPLALPSLPRRQMMAWMSSATPAIRRLTPSRPFHITLYSVWRRFRVYGLTSVGHRP